MPVESMLVMQNEAGHEAVGLTAQVEAAVAEADKLRQEVIKVKDSLTVVKVKAPAAVGEPVEATGEADRLCLEAVEVECVLG